MQIAERESFRYTETEKEDFLVQYLETGKLSEACRRTNVGYETAKAWHKTEWFESALNRLKAERDKQMDQRLTGIIDRAMTAMEETIEGGEQRITKNGDVVTLRPNLAALTMAMGVAVDKRAILRAGGVTVSAENILEQLADKLRNFARPKETLDVQFREVPAVSVEGMHKVPSEPAGDGVQQAQNHD